MQVTNAPNPPPPTASPAARPVPQVEPVEAVPRDKPANNAPANKALERAIVEAAGVKPADSGTVRVTLSVDGTSNRVVANRWSLYPTRANCRRCRASSHCRRLVVRPS